MDLERFVETLLIPEEANLQLASPALVNYYKDLESRTYWLSDEIDSSYLELVQYILRWNKEDIGKPVGQRKPIKIYITSPGGELETAETLISIIKLSQTPVYGYALGMTASAASLIYLACHKRYALENAYFVFHRGSCGNIGGNFNEVQAAMEDYKTQVEKMERFYIENTNYPEEVVREKIKTDWYIHIDEALQYKVVDEVIDDVLSML